MPGAADFECPLYWDTINWKIYKLGGLSRSQFKASSSSGSLLRGRAAVDVG